MSPHRPHIKLSKCQQLDYILQIITQLHWHSYLTDINFTYIIFIITYTIGQSKMVKVKAEKLND